MSGAHARAQTTISRGAARTRNSSVYRGEDRAWRTGTRARAGRAKADILVTRTASPDAARSKFDSSAGVKGRSVDAVLFGVVEECDMDKNDVALRIRQRLETGVLPRIIPPLTTEPGWPASPTGHIKADTAIGVVKCAACDSAGAQVAYRFPDGRIVRFHGRCHRIWEEECQRS
jgi:hypothetical protein